MKYLKGGHVGKKRPKISRGGFMGIGGQKIVSLRVSLSLTPSRLSFELTQLFLPLSLASIGRYRVLRVSPLSYSLSLSLWSLRLARR